MAETAQMLDQAEILLNQRRYAEAAPFIWGSARQAVAMAAAQHGYPHSTDDEIYDAAWKFDETHPLMHYYYVNLRAASMVATEADPDQALPGLEWQHRDFMDTLRAVLKMTEALPSLPPQQQMR